jgi:hypothetical protein
LSEAVDLCAKCGDWEKYCELSIELGNWENAIMAAPHVSISYWKELTKKYAEFCLNNKSDKDKLFSSLLSNKLQPAFKNLFQSGDYNDAKLIWLTRGNQPEKNECGNSISFSDGSFILSEEVIKSIDNKLDNMAIDDDLYKISSIVAKDCLSSGFPLLAACSFLSIKDTFNTFKTLVRSAEFEIAFMLMKILNDKTYEEDILLGLCLKEVKMGN